MSALTKIFDPVMKVAARTYQGMLATELNKMGTYQTIKQAPILMREREIGAALRLGRLPETFRVQLCLFRHQEYCNFLNGGIIVVAVENLI